jgi:arylsulfatase A
MFEGGLLSPGIFFWPDGIRGGRIESTTSGAVDLLPTICGLIGIDKPAGVHIDGADLSPVLTQEGTFERTQPLFWIAPWSSHLGALRDGRYTLMGYRDYDLPLDHAKRDRLLRQLAEMAGIDENVADLRSRVSNTTFTSPEYKRIKSQLLRIVTFQESWVPIIKAGGFKRFELYDVAADPKQTTDISRQHPEVTARLTETLLALHKSVMADAPDWQPLD